MNLNDAKEEGFIRELAKDENNLDLMQKAIKSAEYDIEKARNSFKNNDNKWAIVQAYYSTFNAAKALMYKFRLREVKHEGVAVFLEDRVKVGALKSDFLNIFKALKSSREGSNYEDTFSSERAKRAVEMAEDFLKEIKSALTGKKPTQIGKTFNFVIL